MTTVFSRLGLRALLLAISLASCGCEAMKQSAYVGASDATAKDVLQLIGADPEGFGRKRLEALKVHYPSVAEVCKTHGDPDMMYATDIEGTGNVMVFYYSSKRMMVGLSRKYSFVRDFSPAGTRSFVPSQGNFEQQGRDFFSR